MKTIKLFLLLTIFSLNAYGARLSQEDKNAVKSQLEELIGETKDKDGNIEMDKFNAAAFQSLELFHVERKISREELIKFKEALEGIRVNTQAKDREAKVRELFDKNLLNFDQSKAKDLIAEGQICNHWDCQKGLECAPVPPRLEKAGQCKSGESACTKDSECCSGECVADDDGKKTCEYTFRCYRPVAEGKSCLENPVCNKGSSCEEIFFADANIGACAKNGVSCKSDVDCCSDSCDKGKCVENYRCRSCITSGRLGRGQKCCEDKAMEQDGKCVPLDIPLNPFVNVLEQVIDLFFPQAQAASVEVQYTNHNDDSGSSSTNDLRNHVNQNGQGYTGAAGMSGQDLAENHGEMAKLIINTDAGSNFDTCEINLLNDYVKKLRGTNMVGNPNVSMLEVELALMGFEFVATGSNQIQDYWKGGSSNKSLNERIRDIAVKRRDNRLAFYDDLRWFEPRIKCLCLKKFTWKDLSTEQKDYYKNTCRLGEVIPDLPNTNEAAIAEYRATRDAQAEQAAKTPSEWNAHIAELEASVNATDEGDDAAGVKALELLEKWAETNARIEEIGLVMASVSMDEMHQVHQWMQLEAKWNQPTEYASEQDLYKFEIQNPIPPSNPTLVIALISAGAVAIIGGIVAPASWLAFGVISAAAFSLGAGVWVTSSLRGAWFSKAPEVYDYTDGNSYKCGKNDGENCMQFVRRLKQPYNNVCNKFISSNACIKHFVVNKNDNNIQNMLVDPWIPHGMSKNQIIKDDRDFANLLNDGYTRALTAMKTPPSTSFGIKGSKEVNAWYSHGALRRYGSDQLERTTITPYVLARYAPQLRPNGNDYLIQPSLKQEIVDKAAQYLKEQGWVSGDLELQRFGEYVYANHFVWSKASYADVLAYPQPGLVSYVGLIANGFATSTEVGAGVAGGFRSLQNSYASEICARAGSANGCGRDGYFRDEGNRVEIGNRGGSAPSGNQVSIGDNFSVSGFGGSGYTAGLNGKGSLTGSGFGGGNFDSSLFDDGVKNAIAKLKKVRERQKQQADAFKKAMGSSERGKRMIAAASRFRDDFYKGSMGNAGAIKTNNPGLGNLLGSTSGSTGSSTDGSGASSGVGSGDSAKSGLFSEGIGREGANGGAGGSNAFGGSGGYGTNYGANVNGNGARNGGMSPEDARRLSDAIKSRDNNADKYQRQDGMSLWEIVTNTYIRVYDRLLERKNNDLD